MLTLTADDELLAKDLSRFVEPVELCDTEGKLIGLFVPGNLERGKQIYAELARRRDQAEIERRKADARPGRTTQEVFRELEAALPNAPRNGATPATPTPSTEEGECVTP